MSKLIKPYEISVWEDTYENGVLKEVRLGIIGSDKMTFQGRAINPNLVRNVNGTKKLVFKMYRRFVDCVTGQETINPFTDWLISERKIKLQYNNKWYDFIIKNISENSKDYLYTYTLEDALVQELSKNGFNIELNSDLMNNLGDTKELAEKVLRETDWTVQSEIFVQKVDEALVYVKLPDVENFTGSIYRLVDQKDDYGRGVQPELVEDLEMLGKTVLAFYSCCKNKPHRFQFIYSSEGYNKDSLGKYKIARDDNRVVIEEDCQYYIDIDNPDDYLEPNMAQGTKLLNLYLPKNFSIGITATDESESLAQDSTLSSWYRGKRYGYAQQAVYVPLLEKYCQKYKKEENILLINNHNVFLYQEPGGISSGITCNFNPASTLAIQSIEGIKNSADSGIKLVLDHFDKDTYILKYSLEVTSGTLKRIGGGNDTFKAEKYIINNSTITPSNDDSYVEVSDLTGKIAVEIHYIKRVAPSSADTNLYISPNKGINDSVGFKITDLSLVIEGDYLGYVNQEFVSPTLVQNYITNYKFESNSGWISASSDGSKEADPAKVVNVYGRFQSGQGGFVSISDDFYNGNYANTWDYAPYLQFKFNGNNQFVLNSGIKDNRSLIGNMITGEEWVLQYKILDKDGVPIGKDQISFSLGEFAYSAATGGYNELTGSIEFEMRDSSSSLGETSGLPSGTHRKIISIKNSNYTKETFKKNSKVHLKISSLDGDENTYYIREIALFKKSQGKDGNIIIPDYEEEQSVAAETYVENSVLENTYNYFNSWYVDESNPDAITSADSLPIVSTKTLSYEKYKPSYNEGAKKIRTVTVKESNYFNILQTIAETFEAWLDLEVVRNEDGSINSKIAKFKNYIGRNNYANFRYGLNLKDIQRTHSSKNIVTKLIVKQNSNELANGGFCSIARAGSNPTGENYIYDFQYYQNLGLMPVQNYLDEVYYLNSGEGDSIAVGNDAELWDEGTQISYRDKEQLYADYNPTTVAINSTIENTNRISVSKGDVIHVRYTVKSETNASDGIVGKVLTILHQFYPSVDGERTSFYWADYPAADISIPPIEAESYKVVPSTYVTYETTVTVPDDGYYSVGLRATSSNRPLTYKNIVISKIIPDKEVTIQGYYPRVKKLNDEIVKINDLIIGTSTDLVQRKAQLTIAEALYEASLTGLEETREDFHALTNVYPEEIQSENIKSISAEESDVVSEEEWHTATEVTIDETIPAVSVILTAQASNKEIYPAIKTTSGIIETPTTSENARQIQVDSEYGGIYLEYDYSGKEGGPYNSYVLTYKLKVDKGTLKRIGSHRWSFDKIDTIPFVKVESGETILESSGDAETGGYVECNFEQSTEINVTVCGVYKNNDTDSNPYLYIQPNRGLAESITCTISDIKLFIKDGYPAASTQKRVAHCVLSTRLTLTNDEVVTKTYKLSGTIAAGATQTEIKQPITIIDKERDDVKKYITEYTTYYEKCESSLAQKESVGPIVASKEQLIKELQERRARLLEYKNQLNKKFFNKYSRFILEGTWINEEYVDDDKYYADAQSVLYNSCYPQVTYAINVLSLAGLPGYELFEFELGDKTNVIDPQFFGTEMQEEVIVSEISEMLDQPDKNLIKVQNFKNQFQDLFQKITASVQSTQYSTGSYEKGAALVEATAEKQNQFITDALTSATTFLALNKKQDVVVDDSGITITDSETPTNQIRLVGGAILLSREDEKTKETSWRTGITNQGISADLITTGRLDAGVVQIMAGNEPAFRWDAYGISAYEAIWNSGIINGINTKKFVRFDKNGLYGISNAAGIDGASWHPNQATDIDDYATFALTWEGLKVKNENGITLRIGDSAKVGSTSKHLLDVRNSNNETVFAIDENGSAKWTPQSTATKKLYKVNALADDIPTNLYDNYPLSSDEEWHRQLALEDYYYSESNDGGNTWSMPILFRGEKGEPGEPGRPGESGADYFNCFVESNRGTLIESGETGDIIFTARIFKGTIELDTEGDKFTYKWYVSDVLQENESGKTLTLPIQDAIECNIRFVAEENTTA